MRRPASGNELNLVDRRDLVENQLLRILASPLFARSESLSRLLRHVVEVTLAGNAETLREYTLGVDVFQRGESFDPRCDTIVRVQARKLRARLEEYYRNVGPEDLVEIQIAKGGYIPVFVKREARHGTKPRNVSWSGWTAIAGVLVLVTLAAWRTHPQRSGIARQPKSEALDQYNKARYWWAKGGPPSVMRAVSFYQKAIAIDPSFAAAYAGLSVAFGALGDQERAEETAMRGAAVDSNSANAHSALALALLRKWNLSEAEAEARHGVRLGLGDCRGYHILANVLLATGRPGEAVHLLRQAHAREPLSWRHNVRLAEALLLNRDYAGAAEQFRSVLDLEPQARRAILGLAMSLTLSGNHKDVTVCSALIWARQGDGIRARSLLTALKPRSGDLLPKVAFAYIALGDPTSALDYLNQAAEIHLANLPEALQHPLFDSIRSDAQFQLLLEKTTRGQPTF
jgi:tetratricopeptide (TPR) repeat protein